MDKRPAMIYQKEQNAENPGQYQVAPNDTGDGYIAQTGINNIVWGKGWPLNHTFL